MPVKDKNQIKFFIPNSVGDAKIYIFATNRATLSRQTHLAVALKVKFKVLIDSTGKKISFDADYQVYSAFVYYHSYVVYAEPIEGKGIKDLKKIGDKIVLEHSFSEYPIPGELAAKGFVKKTGEETMQFKGLSVVDDVPCAMLGFDQGECYLTMYIKPLPLMKVKIAGGSHFQGDIYLDLKSYWVKQLTMTLSEMTHSEYVRPAGQQSGPTNASVDKGCE